MSMEELRELFSLQPETRSHTYEVILKREQEQLQRQEEEDAGAGDAGGSAAGSGKGKAKGKPKGKQKRRGSRDSSYDSEETEIDSDVEIIGGTDSEAEEVAEGEEEEEGGGRPGASRGKPHQHQERAALPGGVTEALLPAQQNGPEVFREQVRHMCSCACNVAVVCRLASAVYVWNGRPVPSCLPATTCIPWAGSCNHKCLTNNLPRWATPALRRSCGPGAITPAQARCLTMSCRWEGCARLKHRAGVLPWHVPGSVRPSRSQS